ncbi:MAG: ATP-binding cassette domain-containing protein [Muribaculaceae bacterium]|mgnify:FL=1|nr:ATP-binding cassette domain-containing protein [Muribaculaceae bacterium]
MKRIELKGMLPSVFAGRGDTGSQVWLRDVTLERGRNYLISAESGTGKSSLCSYIYGYRNDFAGTLLLDGRDVNTLTVSEWCDVRRRHIAYLPQDLRLFPELTVMENILLKNQLTHYKSEAQIVQMLEMLGVAEKAQSLVAHLSIGQQQRVALVRTLCQPADFIVLDEPVSHLDESNNRIVAQLVSTEASVQGAGIIATSVGNHVLITVDEELKL